MRNSIQSTKLSETVNHSSIRLRLISSKDRLKDKRNPSPYAKVLLDHLRLVKLREKVYLLQKIEIFKEIRIRRSKEMDKERIYKIRKATIM